MENWKPIETAPKNGTVIEVYGPDMEHGTYQGPAKWFPEGPFPGYWRKLHRRGFVNMMAYPVYWRPWSEKMRRGLTREVA